MNRKYGALSSVDDPQKLSQTVESFVKVAGLIIGGFLALRGSNAVIPDADVQAFSSGLLVVITSALSMWQTGHLLVGLVRKIFVQTQQ